MKYNIEHVAARRIAGFYLVGPWEKTVPQGFEQLTAWVEANQIQPNEWLTVLYDNPEVVPPEKRRCNTAITLPEGFTLPENSEGVSLTEAPGGKYAVAKARVENNDFNAAWDDFFVTVHGDGISRLIEKPCLEVYLNDARRDGYQEVALYIPVEG